jgi:hypothetical protein
MEYGDSPTFRRNILLTSSESKTKSRKRTTEVGGKLRFVPEEGGNMFLRSVGLSPK